MERIARISDPTQRAIAEAALNPETRRFWELSPRNSMVDARQQKFNDDNWRLTNEAAGEPEVHRLITGEVIGAAELERMKDAGLIHSSSDSMPMTGEVSDGLWDALNSERSRRSE
jgi:hypothetical protein